jgi:two-component system, NtrC family, nitrogen regulation sensor histidine kinase GlnL
VETQLSTEIIDQLTTPVLLLDEAQNIVHVNPAFCAWVGMGARRWLKLRLEQLGAPVLSTLVERALSESQAQRVDHLVFRPLPEIELTAQAVVSPVRFSMPSVRALIEFRLRDDEADAAARWPEALSATLKGLAHEVRNPLAGIKGAAQLLARRIHDPDERRYVEVIEQETSRLSELVERLLDPKPARALTDVNVHEILERVRLLAEADAAWSARIVRDYDPSLPDIIGDRDRLVQSVWNLVRNALQAGASEVKLRTRIEHGVTLGERLYRLAMRIDVVDNGRGVPEELTAQIFLPLVSGRAEGTGLGLALTQEIVREHGGGLSFRSRPGHTVFTLMLPLEAG